MFKFLKSDEARSQKLFNELQELDAEKPKIAEEQAKLDPEIFSAYKQWIYQRSIGNFQTAFTADNERQRLLSQKFAIKDSHYRKMEAIGEALKKINGPYIQSSIASLVALTRQVLSLRKFEILEKATEGSRGLSWFTIKNNWPQIAEVTDALAKRMDELRSCELSTVAEIKKILEAGLKVVPDEGFPMSSEVEGGESLVLRFREGEAAVKIEPPDQYVLMNLEEAKIISDVSHIKGILASAKKIKNFIQGRA
ncbi:MAG: hypothetical protein ABSH06_25115 [Thermodesulfobacteriota bacterium]|jgi:uncharacterized protein with HEPN domain